MENEKNWEGEKKQADESKENSFYQLETQKEEQESISQNLTEKINKGNFKLIILLVLSFLVGVLIKVEARNYTTIGAEDYKLKRYQSDFDLGFQNDLKEEDQAKEDQVDKEADKEAESSDQNQVEEMKDAE